MDTAVAQALISAGSGLGGALIGAWSTRQLEYRKDRRRSASVRQSVRMDIFRRVTLYESVADRGSPVGEPGGLRWLDFAGELVNYVPPGIYACLLSLYRQGEMADAAYREMWEGIAKSKIATAVFELRRWCQFASVVLESWDEYSERRWLRRLHDRLRGNDFHQRGVAQEDALIERAWVETDRRLHKRYADQYETDGRAELKSAAVAVAESQRRHEELIRSAGQPAGGRNEP